MSCHNYCSGNYSSEFLRNSCHIPLIPSMSLCSTNVSRGDVLCLPNSSQDCTWLTDNCPETCSEPPSCQPAACEPSNAEISCYSSTAYYVPRPCQGTSFLPASSFISSSYLPISYRPLRYVSSSCHPLRPLLNSYQSLGSVPCDYRPLTYLYNSCRPLSLLTYGCQPSSCLAYGPQTLQVVPSSPRPLQLLYGGCRPLTHAFSTCCPPCPALGCQ